jgi:hypothetical protein
MAIIVTKRPFERCFSGNPIHYELFSALAAGDADVFFEVKVRFKKISSTIYQDVVVLPYAPVNGYATVDLKEILDSKLEFELPQFDVDETKTWPAEKQTGHFYLQFREITPTSVAPTWDDSESDYRRFVLKGGLNDFKYQGNNFWVNYFNVEKPFLSWQMRGRPASRDERMYLCYLNTSDSAILTVSVNSCLHRWHQCHDELFPKWRGKRYMLLYPGGSDTVEP